MNVNPDTITTSGFSGGAFYANNLAIIYSETFSGGGSKCGGPMGLPAKCSAGEPFGDAANCGTAWSEEVIEEIKEMSDEGLIDNVSNLVDFPFYVHGGELDDAQPPALQEMQREIFEGLGANVVKYIDEKGHTTGWDSPKLMF